MVGGGGASKVISGSSLMGAVLRSRNMKAEDTFAL